jgi:hypothetical protein
MLEPGWRLKQEVVDQMRGFLQSLIKNRNIYCLLSNGVVGRVIFFELICNLKVFLQILCDGCEFRSLKIEYLLFILKLTLNLVDSQVSLSFSKHIQFLLMQCLQL